MAVRKGAEIILIGSDAYEELKKELRLEILSSVEAALKKILTQHSPAKEWISKDQAMELLGVKKSRLQQLRDHGQIEFSQEDGSKTIMYHRSSILEYLEKNKKSKIS